MGYRRGDFVNVLMLAQTFSSFLESPLVLPINSERSVGSFYTCQLLAHIQIPRFSITSCF